MRGDLIYLMCYLQARARAVSEVNELRAALDVVHKEKASLSEQLAVLKTQLCFVLQVCGGAVELFGYWKLWHYPLLAVLDIAYVWRMQLLASMESDSWYARP